MARMTLKIALVSALALSVAACSKKKPEELPPPPPQTAPAPMPEAPPPPPPQTGPVPGSRADFLAQAGTDTVFFDTDSYDVDAEDQATLSRQAQWLAKYPNASVTIEGHCDERGTREYNLALGERRANAAKNYLVSVGVPASRISVISYGKERPLATGSDEAAWAQNRRAVTVVPN
ncbi:MAG: peptidoglycan-associated lipoprotein Pal [Rhizorhabdus sp.]|jgi:peptidoglycan-associated lipoprotein|uniref:peptidoglycan-associated lipoprotein Pal n=1 Tax=Rhizorhabdus sp. TaxID=1968843 RepID=UPI001B52FD65|nr:peptidoglycan-associated lipoprotein Pal [Rhizorhabdus sp.]MBP8233603.1 peptidoglycan-associated lipoprotein Pal [Rhizorhabdus sp.]